jgi:hypothetical protein
VWHVLEKQSAGWNAEWSAGTSPDTQLERPSRRAFQFAVEVDLPFRAVVKSQPDGVVV